VFSVDEYEYIRWETTTELPETVRYGLKYRIHEPVDIDRSRKVRYSRISIITTSGRIRRSGYSLVPKKSPGQDSKSKAAVFPVEPKTPGGNKTFKPFWQNGKPKCKKGYRYDYKRKLCVRML
jgi:hypothetical protein